MNDELSGHLLAVARWLENNVVVISHADNISLLNFSYDREDYAGGFDLAVDGDQTEGRWKFSLGGQDGQTAVYPPMFVSPLGAPATYAAIELGEEISAALRKGIQGLFPQMTPLGRSKTTGIEVTAHTPLIDRMLDLEAYLAVVSQIDGGELVINISLR